MRHSPPESRTQGPDLTPMIDVVFLLLVFFVCTMSFKVLQGRLDTELPKGVGPSAGEVVDLLEPIDLYVRNDPFARGGTRVRVGAGASYEVSKLPSVLAAARAVAPEAPVVLHADDPVTHGQVVSVVDACLAGGLDAIRFAAPPRR